MNKMHQAVLAGLAATGALLGASGLASAQTISVASWENLVTPPPPDPNPLPNFFHRPIGSAGIDGTHDIDNRSVYTSDTFGATNGTKSIKQQINPTDAGGRFTFCLSLQMNESGHVGDFLTSGRLAIDVSWKGADWDDADPNSNGYAGINQLVVNGSGQGTGGFLDFGKATTDSWRDANVPQPDSFRGFWDQSVGNETTTLTWDLTTVVDGNTGNNELSCVQAPAGGGFFNLILSTVYADTFNPAIAAFYFDNVRLLPRVIASEWTGLAPDPDGDAGNGNAATNLWHASQNWTQGVAGSADSVATFGTNGGLLVGPQTVNTNQSTPIGGIAFNNAAGYTIGGTGSITLSVSTGQATMSVAAGSHTVNVPVFLESDTTITVTPAASTLALTSLQSSTRALTKSGAGNLAVNAVRAGALNVGQGTVTVTANGTDAGTSKVTSLVLGAGASMDLNDNDLVVGNATSKSTIETYVRNARNNGAWNAAGLTSSSARVQANGNTGLGVLSGAEYTSVGGNGTFSGQSYAATDTLVKYTWNGDANFSGVVNFDDYVKIDVGFNTGLTGWLNGDFNYSGAVNFDDYVLIDVAFNTQSGTLGRAVRYLSGDDRSNTGLDDPGVQKVIEHFGQFGLPYANAFLAAVPEPMTLASAGVVGLLTLLPRRNRRRCG